jgi:DNA repair protein RecN (Recombination protein N)
MIDRLEVRGMGGISRAALEFTGDFIVITGESGAGKSSLVRAFEFISGRRAQVTCIRAGSEEAEVTALWGALGGREPSLSRRSLARSGKGRCWIGDELATVGALASFSEPLIEIQSQFAQLNLLDGARQMELVDQCGGHDLAACAERLAEMFPQMLDVEREIHELKKRRSELERKLEGAPERVRRIKSIGLYANCEREWEAEREALERSLAEAGKYERLVGKINGGESDAGLLDQMTSVLLELYSVAPQELSGEWRELGEAGMSNFQKLFDSARRELGIMSREEIESALEKSEARLGLLRKLKRDTGSGTPEELLEYAVSVDEDTKWLASSGQALDERNGRSVHLRGEITAAARNLRTLREIAAADFERRVNNHLSDLAMDDIKFLVTVNKLDKVRASGAESVTFMLSQKSLPPNPVGKVASGGELSRILIAIQSSTPRLLAPGALVFDEVEAGLGGRTALLAGQKLKELSSGCRTILITHEATIAAMADQHFLVKRSGNDTEVCEISGEDRVREIARMLAGSESKEAMEHAASLLGGYNADE